MTKLTGSKERNKGKLGIVFSKTIQLLSKIFVDSDFCHNYLHSLYLFA